jgi:hypothetical protein
MVEGVNSSVIYLIYCKNLGKCHNVPPLLTSHNNKLRKKKERKKEKKRKKRKERIRKTLWKLFMWSFEN